MVTTSIGDLAGTFAFRARNVALKQDIQRLSTEMTTGAVSDLAKKFSGNMGVISGIDSSLARLLSYDTQTNEAVLFTAAMQASLQNINSLTSDASATLMSANLGGTNTQLSATASDAKHKFEAVIGALNTAAGGRSIFSGVETNSVALADPDVILSALEAATSGAASAQDVVAAVRDWFDDPAGFSAVAYLGGRASSLQILLLAKMQISALRPPTRPFALPCAGSRLGRCLIVGCWPETPPSRNLWRWQLVRI